MVCVIAQVVVEQLIRPNSGTYTFVRPIVPVSKEPDRSLVPESQQEKGAQGTLLKHVSHDEEIEHQKKASEF